MKFLVLLIVALAVTGTLEHGGSAGAAHATRTTHRTHATPSLTTIRLALAFECIHEYEGSWDSNTGNGYYGGLQMDTRFERQYGASYLRRLGHADNWTPAQQVQVAIRAFKNGRGFEPWPNTSRKCGLR